MASLNIGSVDFPDDRLKAMVINEYLASYKSETERKKNQLNKS